MMTFRKKGFTLVELLVVILILAILMAIALPLYLRAVRDSQRSTCRANMQTIANALQAYKVRNANHLYPAQAATGDVIDMAAGDPLFINPDNTADLQALPRCPTDDGTGAGYSAVETTAGVLTIACGSSNTAEAAYHNTVNGVADHGFVVGQDSQ